MRAEDLFFDRAVSVGDRKGIPIKHAVHYFGEAIIERVILQSKIKAFSMTIEEYRHTEPPIFRDHWRGEFLTLQGVREAIEIQNKKRRMHENVKGCSPSLK